MKNKHSNLIRVAAAAILITSLCISCSKNELVEKSLFKYSEATEIHDLKTFMSEITNIKVDSISYNPTTNQFVWKGIDQISKEDLALIYQQSKNN